jgi:hypothetical protein
VIHMTSVTFVGRGGLAVVGLNLGFGRLAVGRDPAAGCAWRQDSSSMTAGVVAALDDAFMSCCLGLEIDVSSASMTSVNTSVPCRKVRNTDCVS